MIVFQSPSHRGRTRGGARRITPDAGLELISVPFSSGPHARRQRIDAHSATVNISVPFSSGPHARPTCSSDPAHSLMLFQSPSHRGRTRGAGRSCYPAMSGSSNFSPLLIGAARAAGCRGSWGAGRPYFSPLLIGAARAATYGRVCQQSVTLFQSPSHRGRTRGRAGSRSWGHQS